jgi:hypothetical protein
LWVALLVAGACGGSAQQIRVTSPFTEEHATAFENGVDYIDNPTVLQGSWRASWEDDIDRRVSLADAIALVTVTTLRHDVDLDRRETYRLIAHVDQRRYGVSPDEVALTVRQGDAGFDTVRGNEGRLLNQRFVAFLKWVEEEGRVVARWHLSPASERVVRRVGSLLDRRLPSGERRRVIVRGQGGGAYEEDRDDDHDDDD